MIPTSVSTEVVEVEPKVTSERVLIVEDDTAARNGLVQLVKAWGFIAESAGDGEEALEKVTTFRPAIVITDLVMPRMDGLALLRALQQQGADVTTLLLTAQGTVETAVEAMKEGAYDYLTTLIESEIFGHEKGAFTVAADRRQGCFELADRGTLFLDEIGEMTPATQVKLLRVLQERTFRRLGGRNEQSVDVRVLAATNIDPYDAVKQGKLRDDLYYRLNVFAFRLPPLRERKDDLPLLVQSFINE